MPGNRRLPRHKVAKVIPLHKKDFKCDVGNYRPILILSPGNKVFEIILRRRLIDFWNKYNLFADKRFGFRKEHSTKHHYHFFFKN